MIIIGNRKYELNKWEIYCKIEKVSNNVWSTNEMCLVDDRDSKSSISNVIRERKINCKMKM